MIIHANIIKKIVFEKYVYDNSYINKLNGY
jgi:hypothetical protein